MVTRARMLASVLLLVATAPARAQDTLPALLREVGIDQHLGEAVPPDLPFRDDAGQDVRLGDYFRDKPVVLVLAYYRCPMLCTEVLNGVVDALKDPAFPLKLGDDFHIVTVSFDARENEMPDLVAQKKAGYAAAVADFGHPRSAYGWHFLTGAQASIDALTEAVGFRYVYDKNLDQFAHASGIMVLTPDGRLSSYFYGIDYGRQGKYQVRDLKMGLIEASGNRIGPLTDRTLLFLCYHYDPATGKYTMAVFNLVRAAGVLTLLALGALVGRSLWRERRTRTPAPSASEGRHNLSLALGAGQTEN